MPTLENGVTLTEGAVVQTIECFMGNAAGTAPVIERRQYDKTLPVIEARLIDEGMPYAVPAGAVVSIRLHKPDNTAVYNPALGLSEDRTKAYIAVTQQMTAAPGDAVAVVEIAAGDGVLSTSVLVLRIVKNPVQEGAVESKDEFKTLTELFAEVQEMHEDVGAWREETLEYKDAAQTSATAAENSAASATSSASNAQTSATQAAAAQSNAAQSAEQAQAASEHYPTISTDGYWQLWNVITGQYEKTTQLAQGPKGEQGEQGPPVDTSTLIAQSEKGQPNGIATLDGAGKLEQMPTAADVGLPVESGTFTPYLTTYLGTTEPTATYEQQTGYYLKIGSLIYIALQIQGNITSVGDGYAGVGGLPFSGSQKVRYSPVTIGSQYGLVNPGFAYINYTKISFRSGFESGGAASFGNGPCEINISAVYSI